MSANTPAVPLSQPLERGTVGRLPPERDRSGTQSGTPSLKTLALKVFQRDSNRDTQRDSGEIAVPLTSESVPHTFEPIDPHAEHCAACKWSAEDWQHAYEERAAIAEHDGRAIPAEAERLAKQDILTRFMLMHLPEPAGEACPFCGATSGKLHSFISRGQAAHAHDQCWTDFCRHAEADLRSMGAMP